MVKGTVVELDTDVALEGDKVSVDLRLPMGDSVMLATSRRCGAISWTEDARFDGVKSVQYKKSN